MEDQKLFGLMMALVRPLLGDQSLLNAYAEHHGIEKFQSFKPSLGDLMIIHRLFKQSFPSTECFVVHEDDVDSLVCNLIADLYFTKYTIEVNQQYYL